MREIISSFLASRDLEIQPKTDRTENDASSSAAENYSA